VKIRLHGTADECREAAERLAGIFEVLAVSAPYPDRGASVLVRVYVEARIAPPVHVAQLLTRSPCPDHRPVLDSQADWYCAACGSEEAP
jgi:hypothetical protein